MDFQKVTSADPGAVETLSALATSIVREYYDPIIGPEQNTYMLRKFQSVPAILEQLEHGYSYYLAAAEGENAGFLAFYPRDGALYLSKLYLRREDRGRGYGREMMEFVKKQAAALGLPAVELNVNKYNETSRIYEKMGFVRIRSEKNDIGSGYYMDDYVYRLTL